MKYIHVPSSRILIILWCSLAHCRRYWSRCSLLILAFFSSLSSVKQAPIFSHLQIYYNVRKLSKDVYGNANRTNSFNKKYIISLLLFLQKIK